MTAACQSTQTAPPAQGDSFYVDGEATFELRPGEYQFTLKRRPEYKIRSGHFTIDRNADDQTVFEMVRFVDMSNDGWWSGDLNLHHEPEQIDLLMRAEDLHFAPLIAWWRKAGKADKTGDSELPADQAAPPVRFDGDRLYALLAGRDDFGLAGSTTLLLRPPAAPLPAKDAFPTTAAELRDAHREGAVHIDIGHAATLDLPVWVAAGVVDSVGLLSDQIQVSGATNWDEARVDRRVPDALRYPLPQGPARWAEDIYFHLLNCGLRLPPTAGSGSGLATNPLGYNRVYVYCGAVLSYENWWENLRAGRVVVTNGPLISPEVRGQRPGHVFAARKGEKLELQIGLTLRTREPIAYLEIVQNGKTAAQVRLDEYEASRGRLPPVVFDQSGWFLLRAVVDDSSTYRAAITGPYYVQFDEQPRISRESAQFFIDWLDERIAQVDGSDPARAESARSVYSRAKAYWQGLAERANAP